MISFFFRSYTRKDAELVRLAVQLWLGPGIRDTGVQRTSWFGSLPDEGNVWEVQLGQRAEQVRRVLKYWRSGVEDACSRVGRPFDSTDAANAALLWSSGGDASPTIQQAARANFVSLINGSLEALGQVHVEAGRLALFRAQAMFTTLAPGGSLSHEAAQKFARRLVNCAQIPQMAADPDFVPARLVSEAVRAGDRYIALSDRIFGSSLFLANIGADPNDLPT